MRCQQKAAENFEIGRFLLGRGAGFVKYVHALIQGPNVGGEFGVFKRILLPERRALTYPALAPNYLWHILLALAAVIITGRLLGALFRRVGQPPVIGEVIGGIVLGPSLLGRIAPEASRYILPVEIAPHLEFVAQLGVIFYMFLVGLDLDPSLLRNRGRAVVATSLSSIVLPFGLGSALAFYLYPRVSSADVELTNFVLFLGLAMSITAFPVLARILTDCRLARTDLGAIALTAAAVGDVGAWSLLAFVVGIVHSSAGSALPNAVFTVGFVALMFTAVRPVAVRISRDSDSASPAPGRLALMVVGLLAAALAAHAIGIHAVFGAFLFGAVAPHDSPLAKKLKAGLEKPVTLLLLPAFFAFTGMRTEIGLVSGVDAWLLCGLIVLVATAGKFGGAFIAARSTGLALRPAAALGALMNARGLMELIVLNVGLELGVISPTLFTMMVVMALVTTLIATPIVRRLVPHASKHVLNV